MKQYKLLTKKPKCAVHIIMKTDLYKNKKVVPHKVVTYYANKDYSRGYRVIRKK